MIEIQEGSLWRPKISKKGTLWEVWSVDSREVWLSSTDPTIAVSSLRRPIRTFLKRWRQVDYGTGHTGKVRRKDMIRRCRI